MLILLKVLTMIPLRNGIKHKGISIDTPGFNVPIVVLDIPHHAIDSFDSKLNIKSILLSLVKTIKFNNLSNFLIIEIILILTTY